jgi:hypothetical protein
MSLKRRVEFDWTGYGLEYEHYVFQEDWSRAIRGFFRVSSLIFGIKACP